MDDFIKTIKALDNVGARCYKQQAVTYLLWKEGPKTSRQIVDALPFIFNYRNRTEQSLLEKGIIIRVPSYENRQCTMIYSISDDVNKFLDQQINGL